MLTYMSDILIPLLLFCLNFYLSISLFLSDHMIFEKLLKIVIESDF
jgi:uncharacterized membrane protein